jgi:hypothetical protein
MKLGNTQPKKPAPVVRALARSLKPFLKCSLDVRKQLEDAGVHITRADFYSCIPTVDEIRSSFEYQGDIPPYLDEDLFPRERLGTFLGELDEYADEFRHEVTGDTAAPRAYFWENGMFSQCDAMAYYCMIRRLRPRRVVELGCGFSTLVALEALERNGVGTIICVEPYPPRFLLDLGPNMERLIPKKAQDVALAFFNEQLSDGDILFIDTTHTVKTGSDCVYLYLKILPYLKPEVMIHAHDVFLPLGYPMNWSLDYQFYWTEQYLLHALLLGNPQFEVCYGSTYHLYANLPDLTRFMRGQYHPGGSSFWFRRVDKAHGSSYWNQSVESRRRWHNHLSEAGLSSHVGPRLGVVPCPSATG